MMCCLSTHPHARARLEVGLGHTDESRVDSSGVLLSSFQRPSRPSRRGLLPAARARVALERADEYSAGLRPRQETTWTCTLRWRAGSSKSRRTTCCQVPRASSPPTTGTDTEGP